jgi:hypothetical protein
VRASSSQRALPWNPDGSPFDWAAPLGGMLRVRVAKHEPAGASLKVHYRSYWFFIPDDDLNSKASFLLLSELFNLQAGEDKTVAPTLTLPVAGH